MKLHSGPTRTLEFQCVKEQKLDKGWERIHEAVFSSTCDCDQAIKITFKVREYPEGYFDYHGYQSSDAEILVAPKVREHVDIVDE
jgi:hypothetical protein